MVNAMQERALGNTPAENTYMTARLDWVSVTLPASLGLEYVYGHVLQLPHEDFVEMPAGRNGYRRQERLGNITVLSDGAKEDMGIHIDMSGEGVREFEARVLRGKPDQWAVWIGFVLGLGGRFSRLDLAIDDRHEDGTDTIFSLDQVEEAIAKGFVRSRFTQARKVETVQLGKENAGGRTLYFGSAQSRIMVRMYDKAAEQGLDGVQWIRTEVQARAERAQAIAHLLSTGADVGSVCRGVLANYLAFITPGSSMDSNRARWKVTAWWAAFLGAVEKLRLTCAAPAKTLVQVARWIERQVSVSFALMKAYLAGQSEDLWHGWIRELVLDGYKRMKPKHYAMLGRVCT